MNIRIVLVDDHPVLRQGVRALLDMESQMQVVGEANNGQSALQMVKDLQPDIVIMDIKMADLNGVEATQQIVANDEHVKVIALSAFSDGSYARNMLNAGASGYVLKDTIFEDLTKAIKSVVAGNVFISSNLRNLTATSSD